MNQAGKGTARISSDLHYPAVDCSGASDGSGLHAGTRTGEQEPLFQAGTIGKYDQ